MSTYTIAIAGGGFSGLMSAVQLLNKAQRPLHIAIIDQGTFPLGVAYSTPHKEHLLNVRALNMSAFPDQPDHFVQWLQEQSEYAHYPIETLRPLFIPRKTYGKYLTAIWHKALEKAIPRGHKVDLIRDTVTGISGSSGNYQLHLSNTHVVNTPAVVLATGHAIPTTPTNIAEDILESGAFISDPWTDMYKACLQRGGDICILGSGLTMVDAVVTLLSNDYPGKIWFHSRKGLLPLSHQDHIKSDFLSLEDLPSLRLKDLIGVYKYWHARLESEGKPGYLAVDKFRPITQDIWKQFTTQEKKYFLRFLRTPWNVARHRIADEIYQTLHLAMQQNKLRFAGGKLASMQRSDDGVRLLFNTPNGKEEITVNTIINCTGPRDSYQHTTNPLIRSMIEQGYGVADVIDLGLVVDDTFRVISQKGQAEAIYATGVVIKGTLWESFAVPDLRKQIDKMTSNMIAELPAFQQENFDQPVHTRLPA